MDKFETPTLAQVIKDAIEGRVAEIHTCMPAIIEKYDADTQTASVSPCLKRVYTSGKIVDLPVITNVPVIFPRGGGAVITLDLQKGDIVTLIFAERSIDLWLTSGGKVDPKDFRKHALSDAYALPGGYPKSMPAAKEKITAAFSKDGSLKVKNENGFFNLLSDGAFGLETPGMRVTWSKDGKVEMFSKNGSLDFISQLLLVIDKLVETTKVATAMGLQPFIPDPAYITERAKLDPFKT